jgi:dinuclear metal center YbgI/SA1388 family protein
MIIQDVIHQLEALAPTTYAEDFDNVGLLVGNKNTEVSGILVTLDTLENVVDEAIAEQCNLIVSFHPIIFSGLKSLTGKNYVERTVLKAIKNDIAIYAIHTALDNAEIGVNAMICHKLDLFDCNILMPKQNTLKKLITYVPNVEASKVRQALFEAGAGQIGNYSHCSFNTGGMGSFMGNEYSNPTIGKKNKIHFEEETQVAVLVQSHLMSDVLKALIDSHPYEEVAYDIIPLENHNQTIGMGRIGEFDKELSEKRFLKRLKSTFGTGVIRHSKLLDKPIKKVAVLGGSGSFGINAAIAQGADAYVTADLKYHDFFKADNRIVLCDIGHYESEQFTKNLLVDYLSKKITNFAPAFPKGKIVLSKSITNPVKYF